MSLMENEQLKRKEELEKLINSAIKKVNGNKENDLCRYLPGPSGGYMHHFTLRKLKNSDPQQLFSMLQKFIIENEAPITIDPKPRAPRGSRKRRDLISFTRNDIERVLELAHSVGDTELVARFSPKRSLPSLKRELIRSIRESQINQELWNTYTEAIATLEATELKEDS